MLVYAHINLLEMLRRFTPDEAVRVATDSIYVRKTSLHKLDGVVAYARPDEHPKGYCTTCIICHDEALARQPKQVAPAQWRNKGESILAPQDHAAYEPKPQHWGASIDIPDSIALVHAHYLTRHSRSYLNGGGGTGKTTRAIELFRARRPLVLTPMHRLAKEMTTRGVEAQTYHSFFRWSEQTE